MALGPVPTVPWSGHVIEGYSTLPRGVNLLYQAVYQWVPTASRMCHPMRWGMLYATAGYPAVTVPLGLRADGMPTGVTFIARQGADASLLEWAYAFEQATMLRVAPPV